MTRGFANEPASFALGTDTREGESLPGYLLRLSARIGSRPDRLAGMAGLDQPGCALTSRSVARLAERAGLPEDVLDRLVYRPAARPGHHRFMGVTVHRELLDVGGRRACPACLAGADHHRACWDLALLTCCPIHGTGLVSRCPGCRAHLGWTDPSVVSCRCGSDVRAWPAPPAAPGEAQAAARLLELASGDVPGWLPAPLVPCDPSDLLRLVHDLGTFLAGRTKGRRLCVLRKASSGLAAEAVRLGVECLENWPGSLLAYLDGERSRAAARTGRYGARKEVGPLYDWLRDMPASAARNAVMDAVKDHIAADPVGAHRMHRSVLLDGGGPAGDGFMGLGDAAASLGRSRAAAKRLLAEAAGDGGGRGMPAALSRAAVDALAGAAAPTLTLEQAASRLGVCEARARRLAEAGLLCFRERPGDGGRARWEFPADAVSDLLGRLEKRAAGAEPGLLVGFETAVESLRRVGTDFVRLVAAALEGPLPACAIDPGAVGLKRLRFAARDVRCLKAGRTARKRLTVNAAAGALGLKWETAAHLVRVGVLRGDQGGIDAAELDRFRREVASGADLARAAGTSPRSLAERMAAAGVLPMSGPAVDGGRQNFYERRTLPPV